LRGLLKILQIEKYKLFCPLSVTPSESLKVDHGFKKGFRSHISQRHSVCGNKRKINPNKNCFSHGFSL